MYTHINAHTRTTPTPHLLLRSPIPQILGVRDCLLAGGPWCAAAAAYLDLSAPRDDAAGGGLLGGGCGEDEERQRQVH